MSLAETIAVLNPSAKSDYVSEVRFGVVMYGGVSLAIYINGVANELYEMACATPKVFNNDGVGGTREVYRKASLLHGNEELQRRYAEYLNNPALPDPLGDAVLGPVRRTRFIVDVISGTSAGGINGAFLAKALANGQEFSPLKKLWILEGNIENLLNDEASYQGLEYAKDGSPPRSLLNSDRMYVKLLDAFRDMTTVTEPLVDEIDLFMTTTDIRGAVVPLRLFDEVVYEKRFKQVYHFQYSPPDGDRSRNDFANSNAPFLAFAARCTSSFPFAFEPMSVADAQRVCKTKPGLKAKTVDFDAWKPFFTGLSSKDMSEDRWKSRAFGDGGYLDNKPFSYVVDALSWRLGGLPMERKLIYVEPAPSHPETERQDFAEKPDAIENAFAALNTIPQYETIREDLEAVLARNRRIERVERIVRLVEADIEASPIDPFTRIKMDEEGNIPDWSTLDTDAMIAYYGVAFLPYRHLRITTVNDDIAERVAVWWGIDRRSDRLYALKALVRVWREEHYYEHGSQKLEGQTESINAFLDAYDAKYRLRRTGFLLRKVHQLRNLAIKVKQDEKPEKFSDSENRLFARLNRRQPLLTSMDLDVGIAALNCLARGFSQALQEVRAAAWMSVPRDQSAEQARAALHDTLDQLLAILLGEKTDSPLSVLYTSDEKEVPIAVKALPPPSPFRTLQENVFERTKKLYEFAKENHQTKLQDALEEDLKALRNAPDRKTKLVDCLLGEPKLVRSPATNGGKGKPSIVIGVRDVAMSGDVTSLNSPEGKMLREFLAEYYFRFDEYDQMSFPLYYDTGTGEPSTVEVLRVSPETAVGLIDERKDQGDTGRQRRKLAGTAFSNFGAFLDAQWRYNDIMWGRLDGCERLLAALIPENKAIREALLLEAQRAILREEMQPAGYAALVDCFTGSLAQKKATFSEAFNDLWLQLAPTDEQRSARMAQALKTIMGDDALVEYVRRYYDVNRNLNTEATMKTGARALTITGRILEGSEKRYRQQGKSMVWVTRAGRVLQTLLTISTPGDWPHALLRHWLGLLYGFAGFIVVASLLFASPAARTFGLTCIGVTMVLHLASLVAGDLMHRKRGWLKVIAFLAAATVLLLALLGAWAWYSGSLGSIACSGVKGDRSFVDWVCGWR